MTGRRIDADIRIIYDRAGFDTPRGHHVRSRMEEAVCDWLFSHGIAHRHASEVFTVPAGAGRVPTLYVPDIVLHDRGPDGRSIILEPHQVNAPKGGGTRLFAAFRREMHDRYSLIIVAKRRDMKNIIAGSYDALVDADHLDALARLVPPPPRPG
jgi:hypothetical protein